MIKIVVRHLRLKTTRQNLQQTTHHRKQKCTGTIHIRHMFLEKMVFPIPQMHCASLHNTNFSLHLLKILCLEVHWFTCKNFNIKNYLLSVPVI